MKENKAVRAILNTLYVRPCVVCGKPVRVKDSINLCDKCVSRVEGFGQTITTPHRTAVSVLPHKGYSRRAMNRFKFKNKKYYGHTFAQLIYDRIKACSWYNDIDCVVTVPMGKRSRLYNQSAVIASLVAEKMRVPFLENALVKIKDNPPFYKLNRQQRLAIIKGTFGTGNDTSFADKKVLLIDDIYTTGATSGECRRILLLNGAEIVYCATAMYTIYKEKE